MAARETFGDGGRGVKSVRRIASAPRLRDALRGDLSDAQMSPQPTIDASLVHAPAGDLLCPACGYDLRGTTGGRCSECGLEIDPAALARSGVPWAYRKEMGRVRAFLKTAWLVTFDS